MMMAHDAAEKQSRINSTPLTTRLALAMSEMMSVGEPVSGEVEVMRARMRGFSEAVRSGVMRSASGRPYQAVVNIGMNIGIMPVTGIPLPLVSYGGSSLLTTMLALGLAQSVVARQKAVRFG